MSEPLVSICIPVYEMNGKGTEYINVLLESIAIQTYKHYEVIISDHSQTDELERYLDNFFWYERLPITYVKYAEKYGNGPANTNNTLNHVNGTYVKMMFQDDFFNVPNGLETIINKLCESEKKWCVSECIHCNENSNVRFQPFKPVWNLKTPFTINEYFQSFPRLGAPSLIAFLYNDKLRFNEDVVMYMDVDFYYKLGKVYNEPLIINEQLIVDRNWQGNIGNTKGRCVNLHLEQQQMVDLYSNNEYSF